MKISIKIPVISLLITLLSIFCHAQNSQPNPFDFGKMWTFENPPKEWFKEAYDFHPEDNWWDDVRNSSLRFATWCSASFVSPDGLIMTNHHCSRDVAVQLQEDGDHFEEEGFYARTMEQERRASGLFVEQLIKVLDITGELTELMGDAANDSLELELRSEALEQIRQKYADQPEWSGLRIQTVSFYSGGKFSLYGYKRYDDIRLVFLPELEIGFFGGDPDNFTFPRYNLDCSFWRAYDENGNPLNTSDHYFKFNTDGIHEGEPVFVIGNPGSTERYRTIAQLEYDRDYRYPMLLKFLINRHDFLLSIYEQNRSEELFGDILNLSNSIKAYTGIIGGLNTPELFERKVQMEQSIISQSTHPEYWKELADAYQKLVPHVWALNHLNPSGLRGVTLSLLHALADYETQIENGATAEELEDDREMIKQMGQAIEDPREKELFRMLMIEIIEDIYPGSKSLQNLLEGKSLDKFLEEFYDKTRFTDPEETEKCLAKTGKVKKDKDPLLKVARILIPDYNTAVEAFQSSAPYRRGLESKIAYEVFQVYGSSLPPDATFTLRISDGVVKNYEYNGTLAPIKTTFFGLYDRHYSNDQSDPWSLPERWSNPPFELLKAPINFVSTNDIIGGNSGSAVINMNKEAVGLIFDGNIESLPGNFIFDEEFNRSVSVHVGGIVAALKYIYGADRLVDELIGQSE